ncbi:MAG: hypothetical protein AMS24_00950 [Chlamydiae bacterium SM23_39]|nr:MAG: hypothetical protein AMS24_00950 [Chlamydiae bacterium SM23_39]
MKHFTLIEIAFFLKKISIFRELDVDMLVAIADKIDQDVYDKKEKVFEINQKSKRMYFIAKGEVDLLDNNDAIIRKLKEGDFFGDESLFNERTREYQAICAEEALILTLNKFDLLTIISEVPFVAIDFLKQYANIIKCRYES